MVRLVCGCLNIKIHATSAGHPVDLSTLGFKVQANQEFYNQQLKEVLLNLEGIHVEHVYLVTKHEQDQWTVHRCNNCKMLTHATHINPEVQRVLVSPDLLSDEKMIERLTISPEYSPLFKVVVKATSENMPSAVDWISKEVTETLQGLQMKLNSFLVAEEQAMEDRIRDFQEEERQNYSNLQTKAKNDKNAIISTILVNIYKNVSESLLEAMKESPVGSLDVNTQAQEAMSSVSPLTFGKFVESPNDISPLRRPISRSESTRSKESDLLADRSLKRATEPKPQAFIDDDDDVFQYDPGFQDDPSQPPFSESDDDEPHDTDDSGAAEDTGTLHNGSGAFSTSMPISVPQWGRQISRQVEINEDDLDAAPKDPESMAASIQALARSIHGDSVDVFGELPTSRTRARVLSSQSSYQH